MKNNVLLVVFAVCIFALSVAAQQTEKLTDLRDGKIYKVTTIGTQKWMAENLAYKTEKGCWAYDNNVANVKIYGYLYNWETAKKSCPKGWHLPSKTEWEILINFLGGDTLQQEI